MDQEKLKRKQDDELMVAKIASELLVAGDSPQTAWDKAEKFVSLAPWNRVPVEDEEDNYSDIPKFCRDEAIQAIDEIKAWLDGSGERMTFMVSNPNFTSLSYTFIADRSDAQGVTIFCNRDTFYGLSRKEVIAWVRKQYQEMLPF